MQLPVKTKTENQAWIPDTSLKNDQKERREMLFLTERKCAVCGNMLLIPTGSCHVCKICGTSNGCS